jgi:hypothetical protein
MALLVHIYIISLLYSAFCKVLLLFHFDGLRFFLLSALPTLNECDTLRHLATDGTRATATHHNTPERERKHHATTQAGTRATKNNLHFYNFTRGKNAVIPFLIFFIILLYLLYIF